jgi:hypothetical protein
MNNRKILAGESCDFNPFGLATMTIAIYAAGAALVLLLESPTDADRARSEPMMSLAHPLQAPVAQPQAGSSSATVERGESLNSPLVIKVSLPPQSRGL